MTAIPYVSEHLAEPTELVDAIRRRRGGTLLNLDRMLLHSPPLARGWNAFLGEVRSGLALLPQPLELVVTYVAVLNDAPYEYAHHAPLYLTAGGRQEVLDAMGAGPAAVTAASLTDDERALLQLTLEMTRVIVVAPATRDAARAAVGGDRELVEVIGVIAAYNMVSRFLIATGVSVED